LTKFLFRAILYIGLKTGAKGLQTKGENEMIGHREMVYRGFNRRQMVDDQLDIDQCGGGEPDVYTSRDFEGRVAEAESCPTCGQDLIDMLVWLDDDTVKCTTCETVYDPMFQARV
jgi:hypothetical protein